MKALIKLHLKENLRKNSFIIFGILGTIVTLIVLFQLDFTVNDMPATSDYAIYGIQWTILSLIASLAGVSLSMNIIANHRNGMKRELLKLHGLSIGKQYLSLVSGNIIITTLMALVLCIGMFIQIIARGTGVSFFGLIISIILYLLATMTITIIISLFTLIMPSAIAALLGIFAAIIGSVRGTLLMMVANMGGLFGKVMRAFLRLTPPLDEFGNLTRDFFLGEFSNYNKLFTSLLYLWILIGIIYLVIRVVAKHED